MRAPIAMPDLGVEQAEWMLTVWLVPRGARVAAGDRMVEIVVGQAVVDLPAPCDGILQEKVVREESVVRQGDLLGWIAPVSAD